MTEEPDEECRLLPAEIVHGDGLDVIAGRLVEAARADGVALTGEGGLLPALLSRVLSAGLEAEIGEHLGYERHAAAGRNSGNSRNGAYTRTVTTEVGPVEVAMPRDRNSTFEPVLVPKGERRMDGLSGQIISLYAKGLTTGEIRNHLEDIYGRMRLSSVRRSGFLRLPVRDRDLVGAFGVLDEGLLFIA
jgi:transposase-like protein